MTEIEITLAPYTSDNIFQVNAKVEVESYILTEDEEEVTYSLFDIEIERNDGSQLTVDEEELLALLSSHDQKSIERYVLEECRYSL